MTKDEIEAIETKANEILEEGEEDRGAALAEGEEQGPCDCAACEMSRKTLAVVAEVRRLREALSASEALRSSDATVHMRIAGKNSALVVIARRLLASAVPNPVEHPTMHAAWEYARMRLAELGVEP